MRLIVVLLALLFAQSVAAQQKVQLPKALVEDAFKKAECEVEVDEAIKDLETSGELSGGLHLVEVACWRAAYNFGGILFALDPASPEKARLLRFQRPEKNKLASTYQLSAPDYNEKTKILGSFHKGRGVGDCGSLGEWRWNGKEFELKRYWNKDKCDGEVFDIDTQQKRYLVYPFRKKN